MEEEFKGDVAAELLNTTCFHKIWKKSKDSNERCTNKV
jgi:hypothetical protein